MHARNFVGTLVGSLMLISLGGCCCCRFDSTSWPPPAFNQGNGGTANDGGQLSKEQQDARDYANKALARTGNGPVRTANLSKDGLNWYVSGTAAGSSGGEVQYEIWFQVTQYENDQERTQTWAVKSVNVDGQVVFP